MRTIIVVIICLFLCPGCERENTVNLDKIHSVATSYYRPVVVNNVVVTGKVDLDSVVYEYFDNGKYRLITKYLDYIEYPNPPDKLSRGYYTITLDYKVPGTVKLNWETFYTTFAGNQLEYHFGEDLIDLKLNDDKSISEMETRLGNGEPDNYKFAYFMSGNLDSVSITGFDANTYFFTWDQYNRINIIGSEYLPGSNSGIFSMHQYVIEYENTNEINSIESDRLFPVQLFNFPMECLGQFSGMKFKSQIKKITETCADSAEGWKK